MRRTVLDRYQVQSITSTWVPMHCLILFHRFDDIFVDSEDVPEYRGHCLKSSQQGLRPRCLDGP